VERWGRLRDVPCYCALLVCASDPFGGFAKPQPGGRQKAQGLHQVTMICTG
jgi:hypothetical protein